MRITIQKLATVLLAIVAATSYVDWASAADDGDETQEFQCLPLVNPTGSVTPGVCTLKTTKGTGGGAGGNGCAIGGYLVTSVSCTAQVTTYPDDSCNGNKGACEPASTNANALKSIKDDTSANIAVGDCLLSAPTNGTCKCTPNGNQTFEYGRKTCGGV